MNTLEPMETDSKNRELRRLAKRYGIIFKQAATPEQWPVMHKETLGEILKIRDLRFESYCEVNDTEQPWRIQTKRRAERLSDRAAEIFKQQRNEAGWRLGLENCVFLRFQVEVACPHCRARIWRSEFEACINPANDKAGRLGERRANRKPCTCPADSRPQDIYELGLNALFEDRVQELITNDPLVKSELPKKEPDRVYGLKCKKNFEQALSAPAASTPITGDPKLVEDVIRSSPFRSAEPLLFPFLILEAKSEKSPNGFDDIQTQTAFPIWNLLRLQEDLLTKTSNSASITSPLVWLFANRGEIWKVYGCYIRDENPKRYVQDLFIILRLKLSSKANSFEITKLWDGSITDRNNALQLLLIIDYVFDWARDVYRPSILKQLKSLSTGIPCDQMTISHDSDIYSWARRTSDWVPASPMITDGLEFDSDIANPVTIDYQSLLPFSIPNTKLGSLRSASVFEWHIFGLRLTEDNVQNVLNFAQSTKLDPKRSRKEARYLVNFLSRWDELLYVSEAELDYLEEVWIGDAYARERPSTTSRVTEFYVLVEYATFMKTMDTWNVTKEISYLAVSKSAFEILVKRAEFEKMRQGLRSMENKIRPCSEIVWRSTIDCIRLGSPWQNFAAAISCNLVSLYSLPQRKRVDDKFPTEALGFGHIKNSRLRTVIEKFHKFGNKKLAPRKKGIPDNSLKSEEAYEEWESLHTVYRDVIPKPEELTFIKRLDGRQATSRKEEHVESSCLRCRCMSQSFERDHCFRRNEKEPDLAYGFTLVESLDLTEVEVNRHDLCLFAFEVPSEITDVSVLPVIVEDLLQSNEIYHTIRHPLPEKFHNREVLEYDRVWNLPCSYRPLTPKQKLDTRNWMHELRGEEVATTTCSGEPKDYWNTLQLLLYYLSKGLDWSNAVTETSRTNATENTQKKLRRQLLFKAHEQEEEKKEAELIKSRGFILSTTSPLGSSLFTRGSRLSTA